MDQRIKEAQQNFLKYQKDSLNRSRYLDMLKNKIQSNGKLTYDAKKNHKRNILGFKFSYIEDKMEDHQEEEEEENKPTDKNEKQALVKKKTSAFDRSMSKRKSEGGSSGNIFSMVKNLNKNELEKEQVEEFKEFNGSQFLSGALFSLFPMISHTLNIVYQVNYDEI